MPRTATITESGNKNTVWSTRTVNVTNSTSVGLATSPQIQQQDLNTVKTGLVFRVRDSTDWKSSGTQSAGISAMTIGADTYAIAQYVCTTSYVTKTMDSGNFKATKRYTQADVDALFYSETAVCALFTARTVSTTSRVHKIEYCYEHTFGGLAPMKFNKIGGLDIGKVWKIGGRSQISGTADLVYG